jgi:hypothetical protein
MRRKSAFWIVFTTALSITLLIAAPVWADQPTGSVEDKLCIIDSFQPSGQEVTNYVVRGTLPLYSGIPGLATQEIQEALAKKTQDNSFNLTQYNLIFIPLIVNAGLEAQSLQQEATSLSGVAFPPPNMQLAPASGPAALTNDPSQYAQILWWPMAGGCPLGPNNSCAGGCTMVQQYNIEGLVNQIHQYLTGPLSQGEISAGLEGRIIYFHCETGTDRTGMLDLSYRMYIKGNSFQSAVKNAINACKPCVMSRASGLCGPPSGCISAAARPMWAYLCLAINFCQDAIGSNCGHSMTCEDMDALWCRDNSGQCN